MSYVDRRTGFVYRFQSYLALMAAGGIYVRSAEPVMHLQLLIYLTEIFWLVQKDCIGRGDGYVYTAAALSFAGIGGGSTYLLRMFVHQLLANLLFAVKMYRQKKLPTIRSGADYAFIPSLFYSWVSLVVSSSLLSCSGR